MCSLKDSKIDVNIKKLRHTICKITKAGTSATFEQKTVLSRMHVNCTVF